MPRKPLLLGCREAFLEAETGSSRRWGYRKSSSRRWGYGKDRVDREEIRGTRGKKEQQLQGPNVF